MICHDPASDQTFCHEHVTKCQGGPKKVWFSDCDKKPFPPVNDGWWRAVLFDNRSKHVQDEL